MNDDTPSAVSIHALRLVPRKGLSRAVRRLTQVRSDMAVRRFAARFKLDMAEAEHPIEHYKTILELFTRRLKPGLRPVDPAPEALVSPVDGAFAVCGHVEDGPLVQAKGKTFSLDALLAEPGATETFRKGSYMTIYLAPRDYHRIHSPADGQITGFSYVPGDLFPVNPAGVAHVDALFATNERVSTHLETETFGRVEVVKVGATNVGHIKLAYDPSVATNTGGKSVEHRAYEHPIPAQRADELGVFEMGSTVVLVTQRRLDFETFVPGQPVKLGQRIARLAAQD